MSILQLLNQNSFVLIAGVVLTIISAFVFRHGMRRVEPFGLGLLVAATAGLTYVWFNLQADSTFQGQSEIDRALTSGQPTMVEIFSNR